MKKALFPIVMVAVLMLTACGEEPETAVSPTPPQATSLPKSAVPPTATAQTTSTLQPTALPFLPLPVKEEIPFNMLAQLGGTFNALAVDRNIVYLGIGPRLVTVDIGDPAAPRLLWRSDVLPGVIGAIALQAGLAYVSAGLEIEIYDTSDPSHPLMISSVSGLAESFYGLGEIFPAGDIVYTIGFGSPDYSSKSLMAFDVSDRTRPTLLRTHELPINAGTTVSREVLYIAGEGKLQLFDAANLDQIFSEIELDIAESFNIAVVANVAYVIANQHISSDSLLVLDVSNPAQPQEMPALKFDVGLNIAGIAATDDNLFLLGRSFPHTGCPALLYVFDVTDPTSPQGPAEIDPQSCFNHFTLAGDTLAATGDRGLQIFNFSDPANITLSGELAPPAGFISVDGVALDQGLAYLLTTAGRNRLLRLRVLDVAGPAPTLLNGDGLDLGDPEPSILEGPEVRGERLYGTWAGVVDISDPANPRLVTDNLEGVFYWPTPALVDNVLFTGWLAATSDRPTIGGGLGIVDISDPANPVLVTTVSMEGSIVMGLSATDRHLIVFSQKPYAYTQESTVFITLLQIFDVSDPLTPVEVGRLEPAVDLPEQSWDFTVAGDTVYVASVRAGEGNEYTLYALDISDPSHPAEIGRFELPGNVTRMVAAGDTIYMRLSDGGIWALNVRDRSHPYLSGHFPLPISDFGIDGDLLYLAAGDAGLYIVQVEK